MLTQISHNLETELNLNCRQPSTLFGLPRSYTSKQTPYRFSIIVLRQHCEISWLEAPPIMQITYYLFRVDNIKQVPSTTFARSS